MSMATRFAGETWSPQQGMALFSSGMDSFVMIPSVRWDVDAYCTKPGEEKEPGKSYCRHASLMPDEAIFNLANKFFGIPDDEVVYMSPSQRPLLEEGYIALNKYG